MQVLGYFELAEDEVPSENIWHHHDRLEEWFAAVKQRRESGQQPVDDEPNSEWATNELTQELMGDTS